MVSVNNISSIATGFRRQAWTFAIVLVLAQASLVAWNLEREYQRTLDTEYSRLSDAARIADENICGKLRAIDLLLHDIAEEFSQRGPAGFSNTSDYMATRARLFPEVRTVVITSSAGVVLAASKQSLIKLDIHERPYYVRVHNAKDFEHTFFSPLMIATPTNVNVIFATHALPSHNRTWSGVVSASLEIKMFHELLASIRPEDASSAVIIAGSDGRIISRAPDPERFINFDISKGGHFERHIASGKRLSFHRMVTITDHIEKISAVRTISDGSYILIVQKPVDIALQPWYGQVVNQCIVFTVLSFALFSLTWLAVRQHSREANKLHEYTASLEHAKEEAESAREALRESQERLAFATEGAQIGIWDFDPETHVDVWDFQMRRLYGLDPDGASPGYRGWRSLVYPDDLEAVERAVNASLATDCPFDSDFRIVRPNGEVRWLKSVGRVIRDTSGQPRRMLGISYDITEKRALQDKLREKMIELSVILDNSSVGITFVRDRKQVWANKRMGELFGYDIGEMTNRSTRIFYKSDADYNCLGEQAYQLLATGRRFITEQEMQRSDQTFIWVRLSGQAVLGDNLAGGSIWTFEEITEQKKKEVELKHAKESADAANKAKSEFLAMMSHEIRTPITAVLGMADLLRQTQINDEQANYLNTLAASTRMLLTILNDILDISKIEAGQVVLGNMEYGLSDAINDTIALFRASACQKGLSLASDIASNLPSRVVGDPDRFKQILFNLTSNAIKFTSQGAVTIRLSANEQRRDKIMLLVEVEDSGPGIAPEKLPLLFRPFSQLDTSISRRYGGTGLGLVITKKLIEMMGGIIKVDSRLEHGTRFWFTLPLGLATDHSSLSKSLPNQSEPLVSRQLRILLAEDNHINQMLVRTMLQKMGHTVVVTDNGRAAVEATETGEFDAILMDMQMPVMDGEEATKVIRALPPPRNRLPIIALTADAMVEQRKRYHAAGVNDLVSKPIDWQVLSEALARHISYPNPTTDH